MGNSNFNEDYQKLQKIGKTIRELRQRMKLSQASLAEGICDRTTVTDIENAKYKLPSVIILNALCNRLGITIDELFLLSLDDSCSLSSERKENVEAYLNNYEYKKAYDLALKYFSQATYIKDKQFFKYVEALYNYQDNKVLEAKNLLEEALNFTTSLNGEFYTCLEHQIVSMYLLMQTIDLKEKKEVIKPIFDKFIVSLNVIDANQYRKLITIYLRTSAIYLHYEDYEGMEKCLECLELLQNSYKCYDNYPKIQILKFLYCENNNLKEKAIEELTKAINYCNSIGSNLENEFIHFNNIKKEKTLKNIFLMQNN